VHPTPTLDSHHGLKAIVLKEFGGPEILRVEDVPASQAKRSKIITVYSCKSVMLNTNKTKSQEAAHG
jgi:hypothetical protein